MPRRPQPNALRVLKGETRPSRLGNEPLGRLGEPVPPDDLSDAARAAWDAVVADLPPGLATRSDGIALGNLAQAMAMLAQLSAMCASSPPLLRGTRSDREVVTNPAWRAWRVQSEGVRRWLIEFGLTPSSRAAMRHGMALPALAGEELLSAPTY